MKTSETNTCPGNWFTSVTCNIVHSRPDLSFSALWSCNKKPRNKTWNLIFPPTFKPTIKMALKYLKIPAVFLKKFDLQKKWRIENQFILFKGFQSFTLTSVKKIQYRSSFLEISYLKAKNGIIWTDVLNLFYKLQWSSVFILSYM